MDELYESRSGPTPGVPTAPTWSDQLGQLCCIAASSYEERFKYLCVAGVDMFGTEAVLFCGR